MSRAQAAAAEQPGKASLPRKQAILVFIGLMLAMLLGTLDTQIVATAMPTISGDLGGVEQFAWVSTAYLLTFSVTTPLYGKLGDLLGRKRVFIFAIAVFLLGSVLCGAAGSMTQLIVYRAVQGVGAGGLTVSIFAILGDLFSPREGARYQSYATGTFAVSSVSGPLLGGLITDHLGWRWAFYINMPVGALALFMVVSFLTLPARRGTPRIDYTGIIALGGAVSCLVLLTNWAGSAYAWGSAVIMGLGGATLALGLIWFFAERRAPEPVVPLRMFGSSTFNISNVVAFVGGFISIGALNYLALYLQMVTGTSPQNAGLLMLPMTAGMLLATMGTGHFMSKTGQYKWYPVASMAVSGLALYLLSTMTNSTSFVLASAFMAVLGLGAGLSQQVTVVASQSAVGFQDIGAATSTVTFTRMLGTSLGASLFGVILNSGLADQGSKLSKGASISPQAVQHLPEAVKNAYTSAYADALSTVFLTALPFTVVGLVVALFLKKVPLRSGGGPGKPAEEGPDASDTEQEAATR
ncbi:EmrB/QacA subfamily drug resistance transporter [Streptomyces sp. Amel2xB2]|uniref:MDR family MFS transporter n=1 Tax=Streptomyces sp. Amel2xB2 TaxID=1305829 RepID=UPI000DBAC5CD|nr:MDR family MFS transporter [Streptomyces sp. Amel2xB2]RAJ61652.1 EmrB/QacA subfamily drug resistance transporter [Streptomyces sp. Amel2xB2]